MSGACVAARWRSWERSLRFVVVWSMFLVLTAFYLIPVVFVQGILSINQLEHIHVIAVIINLPFVSSLVLAVLPGMLPSAALASPP